jgi:hypothetical protein
MADSVKDVYAWNKKIMFFLKIKFLNALKVENVYNYFSYTLKCLLVMDNAPAHPPGLADELVEELDFITMKFLPPNTTSLI